MDHLWSICQWYSDAYALQIKLKNKSNHQLGPVSKLRYLLPFSKLEKGLDYTKQWAFDGDHR